MNTHVNFIKKTSYYFLLLLFSLNTYAKQDSLILEVKQDGLDKKLTGIDTTKIPNGIVINDYDNGYKLIQMKGEEKPFIERNMMVIVVFVLLLLIVILVLRLVKIKSLKKNKLMSSYKISNKEVTKLSEKLNSLMKDKELFLDNELSLKLLSKEMNINEKKLSHFINEHMQTSFYDYINDYRLRKFTNSLEEGKLENYSIMGLAKDAGFKSKTVFYRAFNKKFQCSPSEYLSKTKK